jgi:hypothetical protein
MRKQTEITETIEMIICDYCGKEIGEFGGERISVDMRGANRSINDQDRLFLETKGKDMCTQCAEEVYSILAAKINRAFEEEINKEAENE